MNMFVKTDAVMGEFVHKLWTNKPDFSKCSEVSLGCLCGLG